MRGKRGRRKNESRDEWRLRHGQYQKRRYLEKSPEERLVFLSKKRSRERGMEHSITPQDVIIPTHCPILGLELTTDGLGKTDTSASLDRIDPTKGYVIGNIRVISWRANRLKNDARLHELIALGKDAELLLEKVTI